MMDWKRAAAAATAVAVPVAYSLVMLFYYGVDPFTLFLTKYHSIILTGVMLASAIPFSLVEYLRHRYIRRIEEEIPTFLSVLERALTAGMPFYQALGEAAQYTTELKKIVDVMLRRVGAGRSFEVEVDRRIPGDTNLLKMFKEYLKLLAESGEDLYITLSEYRMQIEEILRFKLMMRGQARGALAIFILVMATYVAMAVLVTKTFLETLALRTTVGTVRPIVYIPPTLLEAIVAMATYIIYIQAVASGMALSIIGGSHRYYILLATVAASLAFLAVYSLFMLDIIPLQGLLGLGG